MKQETYLRKLAATEITDENTVGEAKTAKKIEAELKRFWKKAALEYIRKNEQGAEILIDSPWIAVHMDFNLKPNGSVKIKLLDLDSRPLPYPPFHQVEKEYTILKRKLFT